MSSNQDWYICMQVTHGIRPQVTEICGVNISKLLCENSRPLLERLHKSEAAREGRYARYKESTFFMNSVTNTVHELELDRYNNVVTAIDTKLYVLESSRFVNFQVYDPFHNSWKILPLPPFSSTNPKYCCKHFEWGHMIGLFDLNRRGPSYVFDTIEEKWWMPAVGLPLLVCAVEFSGFLIGVPYDTRYRSQLSIVAYKLDDENGLPDSNSKHTLDGELWELFYPPLTPDQVFGTPVVYRFGDHHVLLVSSIEECRLVVIAVFRVSISTVCGIPVVSAVFEHKQVYDLDKEHSHIGSTFLIQNAPSYCTHISNMPTRKSDDNSYMQDYDDGYMQDDDYGYMQEDDDDHEQDDDGDDDNIIHVRHGEQDDDIADVEWDQTIVHEQDTVEWDQTVVYEQDRTVEWDDRLKEMSLYMCFVENRTDSSVSYIIKATKFSDLISTSSNESNPKLHQVASTSGCHLACLPSCGVFGSLILFAGGGDQGYLREVQPIAQDDLYSDSGYEQVEVPQQVPSSRDIYYYDVSSNDPNIKRFTRCFKGMKPQPVLAEVEGKLYALADSPTPMYMNPGPFFEMFDPIEKQWSPLPDPPSYTKFLSASNYQAVAGTNLLAWGYESPGVFRFDMAADSAQKDWRLINNFLVFGDEHLSRYSLQEHRSTIAVDSDGNGGGDFVLFTYKNGWRSGNILVHLISREFDNVVCLPSLQLPESVSSFLEAQDGNRADHSTFVDLGGRRVCLVVSSPFCGPYSRTLRQFGEVDKMSIMILVFEFEVTESRESVAAEFVFHRMLEYDTDSDARRYPKTSDTHMVGAFLL